LNAETEILKLKQELAAQKAEVERLNKGNHNMNINSNFISFPIAMIRTESISRDQIEWTRNKYK